MNTKQTQMSELEIQNSYKYCKEITRKYAKSFFFATQFLPPVKKQATYALYGFCRYSDNLVDDNSFLDVETLRGKTHDWRVELKNALAHNISTHPILPALIDTCRNYNINSDHLNELIEGVEMDIHTFRYETYEDLQVFCYKVASVVGLMMSEILGYSSNAALPYAIKLGEAMQITNILRDIREDYEMGRVYIPQNILKRFNYLEIDIKHHVVNNKFVSMMEHLMQKAEKLYAEAQIGIDMLDKDSRYAIKSASDIYSGIIPKIRENNYDIYSKRVSVSLPGKLLILFREIVKSKFSKEYVNKELVYHRHNG